jgi:hypothetical protein
MLTSGAFMGQLIRPPAASSHDLMLTRGGSSHFCAAQGLQRGRCCLTPLIMGRIPNAGPEIAE